MRRCMAGSVVALLLAVTAAAYATPVSPPTVEVKDAWIRWLPGNVPGGGYLTLVNLGDESLTLTGASSDAYGSVTLHRSRERDGVSSMVPVSAITLKPHSALVFGEQGYHLMLMESKRPLNPGDSVRIDLHFSNGLLTGAMFQLRSPDMLMNR